MRSAVPIAALWLGSLLLAGCGAGAAGERPLVNTGLDRFDASSTPASAGENDLASIFENNARLLPSLASGQIGSDAAPPSPIISDAQPANANLSPTLDATTPIATGELTQAPTDAAASPTQAGSTPSESARESDNARLQRLAAQLGAILDQRAASSRSPLDEYAAAAALDVMAPGVSPDPASLPGMTPREADLLAAWRDMHLALGDDSSDAGASSGSAAERLVAAVGKASDRMEMWRSLSIGRAMLCKRVDGFGVYTPLPDSKLLSQQAHRMIVYVEVDHFSVQAASGPDGAPGFKVELAQELNLFHDSDGLLVWRQPEEIVSDFSFNRRRDFFLAQIIELPQTLSVGSYRLKVSIRDQSSGELAEAIIPIEIVADAALVRAGDR